MPECIDQMGRIVLLGDLPKRIISLVPSQTELLFHLGLEKETVGITRFCIHPDDWFRTKTRIGGTKDIRPERIHQLQPNLIIANKEENQKEQIESLAAHYPVWISDVNDLASALEMILGIGEITGRTAPAESLVSVIQEGFLGLEPIKNKPRTTYLIWKDPYMTAGSDTFIHSMMEKCGFNNIFGSRQRYPVTTVGEIRELGCELLLLSSEPYPFAEKHILELQEQLPGTTILLVNGEYFSWYGSRLQWAPSYFKKLLNSLP
ncbi:helical backbone metal receptor [Flavihumibacter rivuli]|uniref:ABC transporter substrate-binding protein n=1 Tax=Flavihumibacter rivuli TaxID=2838156 RepID=UPI001BDDFB52|nr:helical backbone metal receptor [Flavihumibacter rivuli]ULQ56748.1 helical backbone metal receptor [Flavihumibacter rivuli]